LNDVQRASVKRGLLVRLVRQHVAEVAHPTVDASLDLILGRDLLIGERDAVVEAEVADLLEVLRAHVVVDEFVEVERPVLNDLLP
jgi:hypothetical protein